MALRALVVSADPRDADRVWRVAHALRAYREIGFFGHVPHVPLLLAALEELSGTDGAEARDQRWCGAGAIHRITGLPLPDYGTGYPDVHTLAEGFAAWSKTSRSLSERTRFGQPWSAASLAPELADPTTRQGDRRLLALELAAESRGNLRFDVDGWIADQRAFLAMLLES
jgi:hypothetical protein